MVADARCVQLMVTRAARVCFRDGACVVEDEGELRAWLLGVRRGAGRPPAALGMGIAADAAVDVNLLRDREEWAAVARVRRARRRRARSCWSTATWSPTGGSRRRGWPTCSRRAAERGVLVAGGHQALVAGPGRRAAARAARGRGRGRPRACASRWWAPRGPHPARRRRAASRWSPPASTPTPASPSGSTCPPTSTPSRSLASLAALCDDAAFPGYPYPLDGRRPAGRLPRLGAAGGVAASSTSHFDRARRARRRPRPGLRRPPRPDGAVLMAADDR